MRLKPIGEHTRRTAIPIASNVRAEPFWTAVPERTWDSFRKESILPTVADLQSHFEALKDPQAMRRAVWVFMGEGTLCPGFQLKDRVFTNRY